MFITADIKYIGVNDHAIDLFEGQYPVPNGMVEKLLELLVQEESEKCLLIFAKDLE